MKEFKINRSAIIALIVLSVIFLVVGVVFALLPDSVYIGWGDTDPQVSKFIPLIFAGVIDLIFLLCAFVSYKRDKNFVTLANNLINNIGDEAIAMYGVLKDPEEERKEAAKTALSVIGAFFTTLLFGFGFYRVYSKNNRRAFILYREGLYVLNPMDRSQALLNKESVKEMKICRQKNKILVTFPESKLLLAIQTKGLMISQNEIVEKFNEVFTIPVNAEQIAALDF